MSYKLTVLLPISALAVLVIGFFLGTKVVHKTEISSVKVETNTEALIPLGGFDAYGDLASEYLKGNGHIYFKTGILSGADVDSFEVLKGNLKSMKGGIVYRYARDKSNVYYQMNSLRGPYPYDKGPSPETFRPIENGEYVHSYGTDGHFVYFEGELLEGADPSSFQILWQTMYEGCNETSYSKDSQHVYFSRLEPERGYPTSEVVSGADSTTFEALINGYGKDKRGYYKGAEYIGPTLDSSKSECLF